MSSAVLAEPSQQSIKNMATRLGMTVRQYQSRLAKGQKYCRGRKHWAPRTDFPADLSSTDGLRPICRMCRKMQDEETFGEWDERKPKPRRGRPRKEEADEVDRLLAHVRRELSDPGGVIADPWSPGVFMLADGPDGSTWYDVDPVRRTCTCGDCAPDNSCIHLRTLGRRVRCELRYLAHLRDRSMSSDMAGLAHRQHEALKEAWENACRLRYGYVEPVESPYNDPGELNNLAHRLYDEARDMALVRSA